MALSDDILKLKSNTFNRFILIYSFIGSEKLCVLNYA